MAQRLGHQVLDKPKPPLWMIFIPVFFVFFAQKMGQYKSGLRDFVDNYLKPRRLALDRAVDAVDSARAFDPRDLADQVANIPESARPEFVQWMTMLVEHYCRLLSATGATYAALVRGGYRTKAEYLLFCSTLAKAENAYSLAILPGLEGDSADLRTVVRAMEARMDDLRRQEADTIYP